MRGEHDHYTLIAPDLYPDCKECPFAKTRKDFASGYAEQVVENFGGPDEIKIKPMIEVKCKPVILRHRREIFVDTSSLSLFFAPDKKTNLQTIFLKEEVKCPEES